MKLYDEAYYLYKFNEFKKLSFGIYLGDSTSLEKLFLYSFENNHPCKTPKDPNIRINEFVNYYYRKLYSK